MGDRSTVALAVAGAAGVVAAVALASRRAAPSAGTLAYGGFLDQYVSGSHEHYQVGEEAGEILHIGPGGAYVERLFPMVGHQGRTISYTWDKARGWTYTVRDGQKVLAQATARTKADAYTRALRGCGARGLAEGGEPQEGEPAPRLTMLGFGKKARCEECGRTIYPKTKCLQTATGFRHVRCPVSSPQRPS